MILRYQKWIQTILKVYFKPSPHKILTKPMKKLKTCPICNEKIKPFNCDLCTRSFAMESALKWHQKTCMKESNVIYVVNKFATH